jgi:hypothetical protein
MTGKKNPAKVQPQRDKQMTLGFEKTRKDQKKKKR